MVKKIAEKEGIFTNWGAYPKQKGKLLEPLSNEELITAIEQNRELIARGNGRCYGDASLGKTMISTLRLNKILDFNKQQGIIKTQSGVLLGDVLRYIVPHGYFLPVSPGTKYITAGGALASDIHGKNHHVDGVFSDHVLSFTLINEEGNIQTVEAGEDLFNRTAGGMGLTGIILDITFKLKPIQTAYIRQKAIRAKNLQEIFTLFEANQTSTYSVAWIDCLATGKNLGRSVLLLGEHAERNEVHKKNKLKIHNNPKLNVPFIFPQWVLNSLIIKIINFLFYHKPSSSTANSIIHYEPYFYPLDKIHNWNRIYGKNGFVQYQFVLPKEKSFEGVSKIIEQLAKHKLGSFLAVLKLFGKSHENRYLHFPMEGYTLALDIKVRPGLLQSLEQLDKIVSDYGGKIYLTKDARMSGITFKKQYPSQLKLNHKFLSTQSQRLQNMNSHVFLILGAASDIAKATAKLYASKYPDGFLILASRSTSELELFVKQEGLVNRSYVCSFDVENFSSHRTFYNNLPQKPNWVMYAAGYLPNNESAMNSTEDWIRCANVNYSGAVSILNIVATDNNPNLKRIIGMSSIAGLRGRKSNFIYGSSKAGFHQYLFGLRQMLIDRGIRIQAVTPGIVKTKMIDKLNLDLKHANTPEQIAKKIMSNEKKFTISPSFFWFLISIYVKFSPAKLLPK